MQRATGILCGSLFFCGLGAASIALAKGNVGDRAEALLEALKPSPADNQVAAIPVAEARAALKRAAAFQSSEKPALASAARATALELANVAQDILRASRAERAASEAERKLKLSRTELSRATALLEETEARKGRALAQLRAAAKPVPTSDGVPEEGK